MEKQSNLLKNTLVLSVGNFFVKAASIVTIPILTGCLSKEEYGQYELVVILASFLLPALTLQIQAAAFRFLVSKRDDEKYVRTVASSIYAFVIIISAVALLIAYFAIPFSRKDIKLFSCLYFFTDFILAVTKQLARGLGDNRAFSIGSMIFAAFNLGFVVFMLSRYENKFRVLLIMLIISDCMAILYLFIRLRLWRQISFRYLRPDLIKEMLHYSWPMVPNELSLWIIRGSDRFVLAFLVGISVSAAYSVANKIPNMINLALGSVVLAWQDSASRMIDKEEVHKYYSEMIRKLTGVCWGVAGLVIVFIPVLWKLLIRGDYAEAYIHTCLLCLASFYASLSSILGGVYLAYKRTVHIGMTTTLIAVVNLAIDLVFVMHIGIYAATLSTIVSYALLLGIRMAGLSRHEITYDVKYMLAANITLIIAIAGVISDVKWSSIGAAAVLFIIFFICNRSYISEIIAKYKKHWGNA